METQQAVPMGFMREEVISDGSIRYSGPAPEASFHFPVFRAKGDWTGFPGGASESL